MNTFLTRIPWSPIITRQAGNYPNERERQIDKGTNQKLFIDVSPSPYINGVFAEKRTHIAWELIARKDGGLETFREFMKRFVSITGRSLVQKSILDILRRFPLNWITWHRQKAIRPCLLCKNNWQEHMTWRIGVKKEKVPSTNNHHSLPLHVFVSFSQWLVIFTSLISTLRRWWRYS